MTASVLRRAGAYEWKGRKLPSVTAVLGTLAKPALVPWAARLVAEAAVAEADNLDTHVACDGVEATIKRLARAHFDASNAAKERGSAIHAIAERLARGEAVSDAAVPADLRGYVAAFLAFWREFDVHPLLVEAQVINATRNYAGTLDVVASVQLSPDDDAHTAVVLDYKTRDSADKCVLYPETTMQLTAYARAEKIVALDGTEVPLPSIAAGLCVSLHPDGYVPHVVPLTDAAFEAFCALVRVYEWTQAQKPATKKKNGG